MMAYRIDWRLVFRAISHDDASHFVSIVLQEIGEDAKVNSLNPRPELESGWECYFFTGPWDVPCDEVIRKALMLGRPLRYWWLLPPSIESDSYFDDEIIRVSMYTMIPKPNSKFSELEYAVFRVVDASVPMDSPKPVPISEVTRDMTYTVEIVSVDSDIPDDAAGTAVVRFENGARWKARFVSYRHVEALRQRYEKTGECDYGRFVTTGSMILVDRIEQEVIEAVIRYLLKCGMFCYHFEWIGDNQSR